MVTLAVMVLRLVLLLPENRQSSFSSLAVLVDGTATHGHPRALVGAAAYAYAAWWLLRAQHTVGFGELLTVLLDSSSTWGAAPSSAKTEWFHAANSSLRDYEKLWVTVVDETRQLLQLAKRGLEA